MPSPTPLPRIGIPGEDLKSALYQALLVTLWLLGLYTQIRRSSHGGNRGQRGGPGSSLRAGLGDRAGAQKLPHISDRARDLCPLELPVFQSCGQDLPSHQLHHQRLPRRVHPHRVSLVGGGGRLEDGETRFTKPAPFLGISCVPGCVWAFGGSGNREMPQPVCLAELPDDMAGQAATKAKRSCQGEG